MADRRQEAKKSAETGKSIIANTFGDKPSNKPTESNKSDDPLTSKKDDMYSLSYDEAKKKYGTKYGANTYFMSKDQFDKSAAEYNANKQKEDTEKTPVESKPTVPEIKQTKDKTWADVKSENGGDPKKIAEWLNNNPDYKPGAKTAEGMVELGYTLSDDGKWSSMDTLSEDDNTNITVDDTLDTIDEISASDPTVSKAVDSFTNPETGDVDEAKTKKAISDYEKKMVEMGAATIDENGNFVLKPTSKSKGWETWATLLSVGLSVIGIAMGVPIIPINFKAVTGKDDRDAQIQALQQQYMDIKASGANTVEQMNADVEAGNIALNNQDALSAQEKHAQATAATKDVITAQKDADIEKAQAQFENDWKRLKKDQDFTLKMADLENQYAKEMAQLQADLSTSGALDIMKYQDSGFIQTMKELGISPKDMATYVAAKNGITPTANVLNNMNKITGSFADVVGSVGSVLP